MRNYLQLRVIRFYIYFVAAVFTCCLGSRSPVLADAITDMHGPLLNTEWDQGNSDGLYNKDCPVATNGLRDVLLNSGLWDEENVHSVVGCVAVAMAQVMKKWEQPLHGHGVAIFLDQPSVNFASATYDWNYMPPYLRVGVSSERSIDAVAQLLYHCGVSVGMDYGDLNIDLRQSNGNTRLFQSAGESSANMRRIPSALETTFGYQSGGDIVKPSDFDSLSGWEDSLKTEIDDGRPVILSIRAANGDGHAVVLDGYRYLNNTLQFHLNFGWGNSVYDRWESDLSNITDNSYHWSWRTEFAIIHISPNQIMGNTDGGSGGTGDTGGHTVTNFYHLTSESPTDNYVAVPGEQIHKTWTISNVGDENWTGYSWEYVYGDQMTSSTMGNLIHLSGDQWQASVDITAPQSPKTYKGYWRLVDTDGNPVDNNDNNGNPYWVQITVKRVNSLKFLSDVNYADGAHVPVGQNFTKIWKVQNTGNTNWDSNYNWTFVSGDQMSGPNSVPSGNVAANGTWNASVPLKAPSKPDTYTGNWRMKDNDGNFFGDTVHVTIATTFTAHVQTTADGNAYNAKAKLEKQVDGNWQTVQDWKVTPYDVSDLTKGTYRVEYGTTYGNANTDIPGWYTIPASETFDSDNLSGSTKTFAGSYNRVDWYAELVSKPSDLTMKAGQMQQFTVTLKNRGAQSWTKDNFHLGLHNAGSSEAGSFFLTKAADGSDSGWLSDNRIHSSENTVGTDQTATFTFWMRAPATAGSYTEHLSLVNDGSGGFWFTDNSPHNNSAHNGPDIALNITVNPDTPPHLDDQSITVDQDSSVDISLHPTGGNGNPWIVQNSRPRHGTLSEGSDSLSALYTPDAGYVGQDSFTVRVADGLLTSNSATISITVEPAAAPPPAPDPQPTVNIPPEAQDQNLTARRNRSLAITLFGFDSDGDALTYQPIIVPRQLIRGRWVGGSPAHGTLTGSGANWTYTPDANFRGRDSFQFTVDDGEATSTGTINITVR